MDIGEWIGLAALIASLAVFRYTIEQQFRVELRKNWADWLTSLMVSLRALNDMRAACAEARNHVNGKVLNAKVNAQEKFDEYAERSDDLLDDLVRAHMRLELHLGDERDHRRGQRAQLTALLREAHTSCCSFVYGGPAGAAEDYEAAVESAIAAGHAMYDELRRDYTLRERLIDLMHLRDPAEMSDYSGKLRKDLQSKET